MRLKLLPILVILGIATVACQPGVSTSTPTIVLVETPTPLPTLTETPTPAPSPTPEATLTFTPTRTAPARPEEAILIQEPGPGSVVSSPIRVIGFADPTFEQNLVIRVVTADGTELNQVAATIESDVGERGRFEVEVPVELNEGQNLFIQVYSTSPRDGGITHLTSTAVTYSPGELENISIQEPRQEQIAIFKPESGETISGGVAHIAGFALASFEQTLVIEIQDADGNVVGSQPVTVQAPDIGQPGPFSADVAYTVSASGPGRVLVRDPSPAFGGDFHLNSVEVTLEP